MILIGLDGEGEMVSVPIHHTGIFGRTGTGKTTLVKEMVKQAVKEGFRVLIFDSKLTQAEFEDMGRTIPFYLQENTDPDVYRSLIEGVRTRGHGNMERFRSAFIQLCEPTDGKKAKDFSEIESRLREKLSNPKIRGYTHDMYAEIYHDHLKLNEMLSKHEFSERQPRFPLPYLADKERIVRMPVRDLPNLNLQGLVVRSTIEWMLQNRSAAEKFVIVVDEAPNFVNQKVYNPAKSALAQLDAQGRSAQLFGWYTGQTLTGFDKGNMKNLYYWIMGGQSERNEVKAFLDTQSEAVVSKDEVKRLKVRQFVVSTPDWAKLVTVPKVGEGEIVKITGEVGKPLKVVRQAGTWEVGGPFVAEVVKPEEQEVVRRGYRPETAIGLPEKLVDDSIRAVEQFEKQVVPKTESIAAFTLQVTRLESDSFIAKVVYILNRLGHAAQRKEILEFAREHGWAGIESNFNRDIAPHMGTLILRNEAGAYRLPKEVKVVGVPA